MATTTHRTENEAPKPAAQPADASPSYVLEAVNGARAAQGKRALTKEECDKALADRPKPVPPAPPKEGEPPIMPEPVVTEAQYLVSLP